MNTETIPNEDQKSGLRKVDWEAYGLAPEPTRFNETTHLRSNNGEEFYGGGASVENELFAEEPSHKPWWKSQFFISEPVLFGTWDGVFTSCLINILGVIVFLRSGWIVAEAGIGNGILMVLITVVMVLTSVLSAIGICERCQVQSGGVYFLLGHVLGSKIGGAIGLIYCFGQAVGCALYITGFGESLAELLNITDPWAERGIATSVIIGLCGINMAGVKWVIKLQFLLLIVLLLAVLDFTVGSFVHVDPVNGFVGWDAEILKNNTYPNFEDNNNWFTVFGVFFPTITGIMAGINMSGDLRNPSQDIPAGTLSAIGVSTCLYVTFLVVLGGTCQRWALYKDYLIMQKVSAIGALLLAGLYISSLSSGLAALYGTPRVLQSIANEKVIPLIRVLGKGRGPNKVPVWASLVVSVVSIVFIMIGQINRLAPIVTILFLLTYACVDYAYFVLAQTSDIRKARDDRYSVKNIGSPTFSHSNGVLTHRKNSYGEDLDHLFPERVKHQKQHSSGTSSLVSSPDEHSSIHSDIENKEIKLKSENGKKLNPIISQPRSYYSVFCNRWVSLIGCAAKLILMFLVHWGYSIAVIIVLMALFLYIGQVSPGVFPGIGSEFRIVNWIKQLIMRCLGKPIKSYDHIIVPPDHPELSVTASQLNEENQDFANRSKYHQISTVPGKNFDSLVDD